jgi:hypothetical protein
VLLLGEPWTDLHATAVQGNAGNAAPLHS